MLRLLFPALCVLVLLTGCDSTNPSDPIEEVVSRVVTNLAADPISGINQQTGAAITTGRFTFFSLRENRIVPNSDSLSGTWDLAFRGTTILVNGGPGRAGQGAAQVVTGAFESLVDAPPSGYRQDTGTTLAIPDSSGAGWYVYNAQANTITPVPGRVLIVRTADGRYAKVDIESYYKDAPAQPGPASESRYYTFRYVFQPDGSRSLVSN